MKRNSVKLNDTSIKTEREVEHVHTVALNRAGVKQLTQCSSVRNFSQVGNK